MNRRISKKRLVGNRDLFAFDMLHLSGKSVGMKEVEASSCLDAANELSVDKR